METIENEMNKLDRLVNQVDTEYYHSKSVTRSKNKEGKGKHDNSTVTDYFISSKTSYMDSITDGQDDFMSNLNRNVENHEKSRLNSFKESKQCESDNAEDVSYIEPVHANPSQAVRSMDVRKSELFEQQLNDSDGEDKWVETKKPITSSIQNKKLQTPTDRGSSHSKNSSSGKKKKPQQKKKKSKNDMSDFISTEETEDIEDDIILEEVKVHSWRGNKKQMTVGSVKVNGEVTYWNEAAVTPTNNDLKSVRNSNDRSNAVGSGSANIKQAGSYGEEEAEWPEGLDPDDYVFEDRQLKTYQSRSRSNHDASRALIDLTD